MAIRSATSVKATFETGDKPTESQFADFIDSTMRDPLVAIATAAEGGATGLIEIESTSAVTTRSLGAFGVIILDAATTASAQGHLGAGTVGTLLLEAVTTASALGHLSAQTDVITTRGDIIRGSSTGAAERLAAGAADTFVGFDGTDALVVAVATQAEQEAGSVTNKPVTPGRQHFHPGHAKAWVRFDGVGAASITADYGVSSVTYNGAADYTVNFDTNFSAATYSFTWGGDDFVLPATLIIAVGSFRFDSVRSSDGAAQESDHFNLAFFGDH